MKNRRPTSVLLACSLLPSLPALAAPAPPPEAAYQFVRGRLAASDGDFREALSAFAQAVEQAPDDPFLRLEYARLLSRLGYFSRSQEQRARRFELAAAEITAAQQRAPESLEVQREAGLLYLELAEGRPAALGEAQKALEAVRERAPEDPEVLVQLGQIYRNRGDHAAAIDAFRQAVVSVPGNRWARSLLGRALVELVQERLREQRPEEAEALLREVLVLDPDDRTARGTLADLLSRRGDHAGAAEVLRGLPPADGAPDLRPRLVWELYQAGEEAEATAELMALIEEDPEQSVVAGAVARELVEQGRPEEARGLLAGLMERLEAGGEGPAAGLRLELAELEVEAERWPEAAALLAPLEAFRDAPPPGARGWRLLYSEVLVQLGRGEEALELLPAQVGEPAAGDAARSLVAKRAEVLFRLDRPEEAGRLLESLTADGDKESLRQAARVYQRLERYAEAVPLLKRLLELEPESVEGLYFLGSAYERTSRHGEAETTFRALLELEPDFAPALNYLAYMWAERGENLDEALAMVNRAVGLDPENGAYVDSLGWTHFQLGEYEQARTHLERASRLEPDDPVIFEHLGDVYLALGMAERAQEFYRRSLALGDENASVVRRKLESLGATPDGK